MLETARKTPDVLQEGSLLLQPAALNENGFQIMINVIQR